jgi:hypothetical protein
MDRHKVATFFKRVKTKKKEKKRERKRKMDDFLVEKKKREIF